MEGEGVREVEYSTALLVVLRALRSGSVQRITKLPLLHLTHLEEGGTRMNEVSECVLA